MSSLAFSKMHGLGNDFVIIGNFQQPIHLAPATISHLADRHQGIGFDQLLLLSPSTRADLACQIFNADGSEALQCGNGLRCVARFAQEEKIISKPSLTIETKAGVFEVNIHSYDKIRVNMGLPKWVNSVTQHLDGMPVSLTALSLGNPHAIHRVASAKESPVSVWGAAIEKNPAFPEGVNSGFMEVINRQQIRLRTYERGVGETLACGSNACAAVIAGIKQNWLDSKVSVSLIHGSLEVEWPSEASSVFLTGPAARVFSGIVEV